ncbi:MAG: hypothetical protein R3F43_01345 [bacterium]
MWWRRGRRGWRRHGRRGRRGWRRRWRWAAGRRRRRHGRRTCFDDTGCEPTEYCAPVNDLEGVCRTGCRPDPRGEGPGNCEGRTICSEDHQCIQDPRCIDDTECVDQTTWCDDGECVPGCRPDPDNCLPDEEGRSRRCDPATRACERLVALLRRGHLRHRARRRLR